MTNIFKLTVPFPPSVNTYWGFKGSQRFLTSRAKVFKSAVAAEFVRSGHEGFGTARLAVTIKLYPPDRRVRDIDNVIKSTLDALCQALVFVDDGQIDALFVTREQQVKWGAAEIFIEALAK